MQRGRGARAGRPWARGRGRGRGPCGPCRFGAACTRADCFFSHPPERVLPAAGEATVANTGGKTQPPSPTRAAGQVPCRFGAACTRADCFFSHPPERVLPAAGEATAANTGGKTQPPSPSGASEEQRQQRVDALAEADAGLPQPEPQQQPQQQQQQQQCRFGARCTRPDCTFGHPERDGTAGVPVARTMSSGRGGGRGSYRGRGGGRGGAKQSAVDVAAADAAATAPLLESAASGPVCCIDVECVATGTTHHDRSISQIALVDLADTVICDLYVIPEKPVVSYLTPLTGCNEKLLGERGTSLEQALETLRVNLARLKDETGSLVTLVGQNIR
eukprot:COSAG02_NODE_1742_length_11105_cov_11.079956_5_plen_332_part_00